MGLGTTEILLIVVVIVLLFGAKRIPDLARAFGRASAEYKKAKDELARESQEFTEVAEKAGEAEAKREAAATPAESTPADHANASDK